MRVARGRIDAARLGAVVSRAAAEGDPVATAIFARAGRSLGRNAAHAVRTLGMQDEDFDLVLAGGTVRGGGAPMIEEIREAVLAAAPRRSSPCSRRRWSSGRCSWRSSSPSSRPAEVRAASRTASPAA